MARSEGNLRIQDKVSSVFRNKIGEEFLREEIIDLVVNAYPGTNRSSVIPSDYCYNLINAGIAFNFHLFEHREVGLYRCLGEEYQYTGPIYWKKEQAGEWRDGKYRLWQDPRKHA